MRIAKELFKYYILMIMIFFIGRVILFVSYFDRFKDDNVNYWLTFLHGLRMDTMMASYLLIIPLILLTLSPKRIANIINQILKYYFIVIISLLVYIEIATIPFMAQYDLRPNYMFVKYLSYPKEVFAMIFASYKLQLFISLVAIIFFIFMYVKRFKNGFLDLFKIKYAKRLALFIPLALVLVMGFRSSLGHKPASIIDAMYSQNRILNEITKNSLYSILSAVDANLKFDTKDISKIYGKMDMEEAKERVQRLLAIKGIDNKYFLTRLEPTHFKSKSKNNLVIFLQESLGAQFVRAVGGEKGITPNLNRLAKESIVFSNTYSNGTRSIRGIAGTVAGSFSIPGGKGVVRRIRSETNWFTIAKVFKPLGYHVSFMYGGDSHFEHMRGWFLGNGFDEVIDRFQFKNSTCDYTWGICDEEVVDRANEEFKKLYAKHQNFATVIFSTSNHLPYEFPDGKIELVKGVEKYSVKNTVKYADYAIGKLIKKAKEEGYYKDTLFVIVADHNVRVYGDDMVPVNMFHIPALILGGGIKPQIYNKIASQSDVLATAIDLMGIETKMPILGHSIFSDKKQNVTLMQFSDRYALMVNGKVAVLRPHMKPLTFLYKDQHLVKTKEDKELEKNALALVLILDFIYKNELYK